MIENYKEILTQKYAAAEGRATRSEYWLFVLANFIISFLLAFVTSLIGLPFIASLYGLAVIVPGICVGIRRLHDTGKSGWWLLISLTGIGAIILIIFYCLDSDPGTNAYGPNPKRVFRAAGETYHNANNVHAAPDMRKEPVKQEYANQHANQQAGYQQPVPPKPADSQPVWVPEDDDDVYEEKTAAFFDDMTVSLNDDEKTVALIDERVPVVKLTRLADNRVITCRGNVFTVGKSLKSANYAISDSDKVSRKHATFTVKGDQYCVSDNSKNGTRINGVPVREGEFVPVKDGDRIEFADEAFIFNISK